LIGVIRRHAQFKELADWNEKPAATPAFLFGVVASARLNGKARRPYQEARPARRSSLPGGREPTED